MLHIIAPVPNNNGSSKQDLLDQMLAAREALQLAVTAMQAALPDGRDYQSGGEFFEDRDEAVRRIAATQDLAEQYYNDAINLQNGSD